MPKGISIQSQVTSVKNIDSDSGYRDKLLKLVPGEVVAGFLALFGLFKNEPNAAWLTLGLAIFLTLLIPFYLIRLYGVSNVGQIIVTILAYFVWLYSLGQPFVLWQSILNVPYTPIAGSALLIIWTILIPFLNLPLWSIRVPVIQANNQA